jgi:uncharacterized protein
MTGSKIKEHIRRILHVDETPHELAKAFAAGVFVAFTPFLGLHTAIILIIAWAFRLNKLAALTGTFLNNPWTIAFVYIGPTWLMVSAMRALGVDIHPMNYELISTHFQNHAAQHTVWEMAFWKDFAREFKPYVTAFILGTMIAGAASAVAAYVFSYFGIKYYRRGKEKLKQEKVEEREKMRKQEI